MAKIIVQFSGGKDSLASLIWTRNNITKDFITVFCDTGWESDITYKHIEQVGRDLGLNIVTLKSKKYEGFYDLAKKKKRFPSVRARFCTEELKSKPMIDYILDEINDDVVIIQGIRKAESISRSKMSAQCTYFKYYVHPYGKDKTGKDKYHTYRKKEILRFRENHADDIIRPVFDWSGQQVIDYIISNGMSPNPLYSMGMKRVGCFPCIMANNVDIRSLAKFFPDRLAEICRYEVEAGSTFFGPDSIPSWAYKGAYPLLPDVIKYVTHKLPMGGLFGDEEQSCMSFYGLCE
jgi:3'-phosphoadenosine 5'-phosphosulfate sulfotransferase (PAPS reductase)/FAD synthetase